MKIRIGFNGSFSGLVYSAGYAYDPDCMYINGSGRDYYEFYIQLNRCGTLGKNALHDENRKNPTVFQRFTIFFFITFTFLMLNLSPTEFHVEHRDGAI